MKNRRELQLLAEKHGIKTSKRVFFEVRGDSGGSRSRFMDVPRPADELYEDLVAIGVLS